MDPIVGHTPGSTIANGAIDREAYPKSWYVALVQVKCEKKYAKKLESLGYETFVPTQQEIHQWSDRRKKIDRILIPLMVFFKSDADGAREVNQLSFIHSLLKAPGSKHPATIPDDQINRLKFMICNCDDEITIEPASFEVGHPVRVIRGPLKGLEGEIMEWKSTKSELIIGLNYIGYAKLSISTTDIELTR